MFAKFALEFQNRAHWFRLALGSRSVERAATAKHGIPVVFDEIVTGFRFAYGGAQEHFGVVPDVCALGKILGGGFPFAATTSTLFLPRYTQR